MKRSIDTLTSDDNNRADARTLDLTTQTQESELRINGAYPVIPLTHAVTFDHLTHLFLSLHCNKNYLTSMITFARLPVLSHLILGDFSGKEKLHQHLLNALRDSSTLEYLTISHDGLCLTDLFNSLPASLAELRIQSKSIVNESNTVQISDQLNKLRFLTIDTPNSQLSLVLSISLTHLHVQARSLAIYNCLSKPTSLRHLLVNLNACNEPSLFTLDHISTKFPHLQYLHISTGTRFPLQLKTEGSIWKSCATLADQLEKKSIKHWLNAIKRSIPNGIIRIYGLNVDVPMKNLLLCGKSIEVQNYACSTQLYESATGADYEVVQNGSVDVLNVSDYVIMQQKRAQPVRGITAGDWQLVHALRSNDHGEL